MDCEPEFKHLTEAEIKEVESKLQIEAEFMPEKNFYNDPANLELRKVALSTIATHCKGVEVDAFVPYIAMKYFDCFFARQKKKHDPLHSYTDNLGGVNPKKLGLDLTNVEEVSKVATTCLIIAARTREGSVNFFMDSISVDFDIEEKELQIENQLPWETYPVTPFYFLDYFYPPFEEVGGFRCRGINEIIVQAQGDEEFITYKPSHIAFSSLAAAADIIYPTIEIEGVTERIATGLALCVTKLVELCFEKNIKIESASSSSVAVAIPHRAAAKGKGKGKGKMSELDQILEEEEDPLSLVMFRSEAPKSLMNFYLQWPMEIAHRRVPHGK